MPIYNTKDNPVPSSTRKDSVDKTSPLIIHPAFRQNLVEFKELWETAKKRAAEQEKASLPEADRDKYEAKEQLEEIQYRTSKVLAKKLRYSKGDMQNHTDAVAIVKQADKRLEFLRTQQDRLRSRINPTSYTQMIDQQMEKFQGLLQSLSNRKVPIPNFDEKAFNEWNRRIDHYLSLNSQQKDSYLQEMGVPIKPEEQDGVVMSAVEWAGRNLGRLLWFETNLATGALKIFKGSLVDGVAEWRQAVKALTGDTENFTPALMKGFKEVWEELGVSGEPHDPEKVKQLDQEIEALTTRMGRIAKNPEPPRLTKHGTIYPSESEVTKLQDMIKKRKLQKFVASVSPSGALGLLNDIIMDPLIVVPVLKVAGMTAKSLSKGAAKVAENAIDIVAALESKVPRAVRDTDTFQRKMERLKGLKEGDLLQVLSGRAPITSAPVVRYIAQGFYRPAGVGKTHKDQKAIVNAIEDFYGESQFLKSEAMKELHPIIEKLKPIMKKGPVQEESAYALVAMQDSSHALISSYAEVTDILRRSYKQRALSQTTEAGESFATLQKSGTELDQAAYEYAEEVLKKNNYDLQKLRELDEIKSPSVELPDFSKGKIDKDLYLYALDQVPEELFDDIVDASIKNLGKDIKGANAKQLQGGIKELLGFYRKQGIENERLEIIKTLLPNYSPRQWEEIVDKGVPAYVSHLRYRGANFAKHRKFPTWKEAAKHYEKAGLKFNTDVLGIAKRYASRSADFQSEEKLVTALEEITNVKRGKFGSQLKSLINDTVKGRSQGAVERKWRKWFINNWKMSMLYGHPAYHIRNIIDDSFRTYLEAGGRPFKASNIRDALHIMSSDPSHVIKLGKESITSAELYEKLFRKGILKNYHVRGDFQKSVDALYHAYKTKGVTQKTLSNLWKSIPLGPEFGIMMNNFARTQLATSLIKKEMKAGKSLDEAINIAREGAGRALINYETAGPAIEALSNIFPFVRFHSGSLAFYANVLYNKPHRLNRLHTLFNHSQSQNLTNDEKSAMLPFLQERMKFLLREDETGTRYWLYNLGLSWEAVNDFVALGSGEGNAIDTQRSLEKIAGQSVLVNMLVGVLTERDPYFGWEWESTRGRRTYKYFYDNKILNKLVGGVDAIPIGRDAKGKPIVRYQVRDKNGAYWKFMNIALPVVNSSAMLALRAALEKAPSLRNIGINESTIPTIMGQLSSRGLLEQAHLLDPDKTKLEKSLRLLSGMRILKEDAELGQYYKALKTLDKANKDLTEAASEAVQFDKMDIESPDIAPLWEAYQQSRNKQPEE